MIGIYRIINKITNQCYIGQSIDIARRWRTHRQLSQNLSFEAPLYKAIREYGLENFEFEILSECQLNDLNSLEKKYISQYNSYIDGYNQTSGGAGTSNCCIKISNESLIEIYDLLINTDISISKIAEMYHVGIDTISEINTGKTRIREGYNYPLRQKRFCLFCGKQLIHGQNKFCSVKCASDANRQNRPNREELKKLIRTISFTQIGKLFGVSDNTIRKWCVSENLPSKAAEIKQYSDMEWSNV